MSQPELAAQVAAHAEAIRTMDAMSQEGFGRIAALARMALLALESETVAKNIDCFAGVFDAIRSIAEDIENCINVEAERAGANYTDPALSRRQAASRRADASTSGRANHGN